MSLLKVVFAWYLVMSDRKSGISLFAFSLVAIPALVHAFRMGAYKSEIFGGTYWVGPISTTIPYAGLAALFLAHCYDHKPCTRRSAYVTAATAWLSMMAFSVFLICQNPAPNASSTIGIAMVVTPFLFVPFLIIPYLAGSIISMFFCKKNGDDRKNT